MVLLDKGFYFTTKIYIYIPLYMNTNIDESAVTLADRKLAEEGKKGEKAQDEESTH